MNFVDGNLYLGLSSESKPTGSPVQYGARFFELDTRDLYVYDSTGWVLTEAFGKTVIASGELTRPSNTDAYIAGDVVSNATDTTVPTAVQNLARANGGSGYITAARLTTNLKSITPRFRVHLFNAVNPTVSADNAPYQEKYADAAKRIGSFDLPALATAVDTTNSDMSRAMDFSLRIPFKCAAATRSVWYVLEALDGFTPASGQKFTLTLSAELN